MNSLHHFKTAFMVSLVACFLLGSSSLVGQDDKKETEKKAAQPKSANQDLDSKSNPTNDSKIESKKQESGSGSYLELMNEWKTRESKLKEMEAEYVVVGQARKNEIRVEYNKALSEVEEIVEELRAKAIETYEKNPNQDESLVRLLIGMLTDDLQKRRYAEFFALGKTLIQGKCDIKHFKALHKAKRLVAFGTDYYIDELIARLEDAKRDDLPRAVIKTSYGDIEIELFEENAPNHVANFISLASKKFYDESKWHRVDKVQNVVQGGQPADGKDIDYTLAGEWDRPNRRRHFKGNVGAARTTDPNSASSQFYIVTDRVPEFDVPGNSYTVFGRVISGMEFVHQIKPDDKMLTVEIIRKRDHEYTPKPYKPGENPPVGEGKGAPEKKAAEKKTPEKKNPEKGTPEKKVDPKKGAKAETKKADPKSPKGEKSASDKSESGKSEPPKK